jgi:hypothetical protein
MRRALMLLVMSGLLALHHGLPMADAAPIMAGDHGSAPMALGMTMLCAGVIASAIELVRRAAMRAFGQGGSHRASARSGHPAAHQAPGWRGRPPPRPLALALLCVNQR